MRAWMVEQFGEPLDVMVRAEHPEPDPGPGEAVLAVGACALGYPDLLLTKGLHQEKPSLPMTPGVEVSGTIHRAAPDTGLQVGQRVVGVARLPDGGLAELAVARASDLHPLAGDIDFVTGAASYTAFQTAWFALHRRAALVAGETLLVTAGAGGVGSAAIQLGVAAGAHVIAAAGGPQKVELCRKLGAAHAIDYLAEPDFAPLVNDLTDGRGADVIFDPVGGDVFDRARRCIAWEGRLVVIGFASETIPTIRTNHVLIKNYSLLGLYWGPYRDRNPALIEQAHDEITALLGSGRIEPLVMRTDPFDAAPAALQSLGGRGTYGRLVVTP